MTEVEQWLIENIPIMSQVGSGYVNPSFRSEDLTLHIHRIHGTVAMYLITDAGGHARL